jgi:hypothetical protein
MSVSQMRAEDRLAGASNWSPWKTRIIFVLEDLELWDIVQALMVIPPAPAPSPLLDADFRKKNTKAKRTICDAVRDHIIPHLTGKDYAFEIWASLCKLYQSPNQNRRWFCRTNSGAFRCSRQSRSLHTLADSLRFEMS